LKVLQFKTKGLDASIRCRAKIPIKGIERLSTTYDYTYEPRCRAKIPIKGIDASNFTSTQICSVISD
jgi:hypothetical protein